LLLGSALALATTLALAWKWRLAIRMVLPFVLTVLIVGAGITGIIWWTAGLASGWGAALIWIWTVGGFAVWLVYRFYRDPERTPPDRDDVVVSPADGEVIYVSESRRGLLPTAAKSGRRYTLRELVKTSLPTADATVFGIALNVLDVHVNRAPIAGRVVLQRRHGGPFRSLRRLESVFDNERVTIVIERNGLEVALVLIASRLVRRIVEFVHEGETVALGQRIGAIRFGSQVDVVVPHTPGFKVLTRIGEHVVAGESLLAVTGMRQETGPAERRADDQRISGQP
jgi:phosphatidylserine decarboxylase